MNSNSFLSSPLLIKKDFLAITTQPGTFASSPGITVMASVFHAHFEREEWVGTHVLQLLYGGERELGRGGETIIVKDVAFTYFLEFIVYPKFYLR